MAFDDAWEKSVWTEPLSRAVEGVSPEEAHWHPTEETHSIVEIVNHIAYWKQYCARMLTTQHIEDLLPRPPDGEAPRGMPDWPQAVENLRQQHQALRIAVAALQPEQLTARFPLTNMTVERVIAGLIAHDAYHAGRILLVRRQWAAKFDGGEIDPS